MYERKNIFPHRGQWCYSRQLGLPSHQGGLHLKQKRRNIKRWESTHVVRHVLLHTWWLSTTSLSSSTPPPPILWRRMNGNFNNKSHRSLRIYNPRVHSNYPQFHACPFPQAHSSTLTLRNKQILLQQQTKNSFVFVHVRFCVSTLVGLLLFFKN